MSRRLRLMLPLLLLALALPAGAARAQTDEFCFTQATGYCIAGRIREFWTENDGLRVFGYPITPLREEEIEGRRIQVQWFERNRLELHPQNARPYDVLIGRLGADQLAAQGRSWPDFPKSAPQSGCRFFAETGHNVCGAVLRSWRALGIELDGVGGRSEAESLALFGLPLSGPRTETLGDGRRYTVQWFERGRFELHNEFAPPNDVLFGLLGSELLEIRKSAPPAGSAVQFTPSDGSERILFESNRYVDGGLFPGADPYTISYVYGINPNGYMLTPLTRNHAFRDEGPSYAPGGGRVAFWAPRAGGLPDIYTVEPDGARLTRLTDAPAADGFAAWSPDGSRIAFASERDGNWEIYVMGADGGGQINISRSPGSTDWAPTWSPDGGWIAFESTAFGQQSEIVVMRADGGQKGNITNTPAAAEANPAWSPDGRLIAFETDRAGNREIFIMGADGSNPRNLTRSPGNDLQPSWSPDGARLAFETDRDGNREIYLMLSDGSGQTNVTNSPADERNPSWSPRLTLAGDLCPDVPDPINARVAPGKCISRAQAVTIDVFGFLPGSRFAYRVTDPSGSRSDAIASSQVNASGELAGIAFQAGQLSPGRWTFEFTFTAQDGRSFYGSTVYLRVDP